MRNREKSGGAFDEACFKLPVSAVIFDLDGTLLYTLESLCDSTNYALRAFGCRERTMDEVRSFVGNGVRKLIERALPQDFDCCASAMAFEKPSSNSSPTSVRDCEKPSSNSSSDSARAGEKPLIDRGCAFAAADKHPSRPGDLNESGANGPFGCAGFEGCLKVFKEHYSKTMFDKTRPYDGVIEVLEALKKSGVKRAVVSNKFDTAVKELCEKYFAGLLDTAAGESAKIPPKPSPKGVLKVIKELGCNPSECVYVGDSEIDIETAKNAGIRCISAAWGYKDTEFLLLHGAKQIVSTPKELLGLISQAM